MAKEKFKLTKEHITLLRYLVWDKGETNIIELNQDSGSPFGGDSLYEDVALMIYGKLNDFDPNSEELYSLSDEQKTHIDQLIEELPKALSIFLSVGELKTGTYTKRWNTPFWEYYKKRDSVDIKTFLP